MYVSYIYIYLMSGHFHVFVAVRTHFSLNHWGQKLFWWQSGQNILEKLQILECGAQCNRRKWGHIKFLLVADTILHLKYRWGPSFSHKGHPQKVASIGHDQTRKECVFYQTISIILLEIYLPNIKDSFLLPACWYFSFATLNLWHVWYVP